MSYISMDLDTTVFDSINFPFIVTYWVDTLENRIIKFLPSNTYYIAEGYVKIAYDSITKSLKTNIRSYYDFTDEDDGATDIGYDFPDFFSYGIYYTRGDTLYLRSDMYENIEYLSTPFAVYKKGKDELKFLGYKNKITDKEIYEIKGENLRRYSFDSITGKYNRVYSAVMLPIYNFVEKNSAYKHLIKLDKVDSVYCYENLCSRSEDSFFDELVKIDTTLRIVISKGKRRFSYHYHYERKKVAYNFWKIFTRNSWKLEKEDERNKKLKNAFNEIKFNEDNSFVFYNENGEEVVKGIFLVVKNIVRLYYSVGKNGYATDFMINKENVKDVNNRSFIMRRLTDFDITERTRTIYKSYDSMKPNSYIIRY